MPHYHFQMIRGGRMRPVGLTLAMSDIEEAKNDIIGFKKSFSANLFDKLFSG